MDRRIFSRSYYHWRSSLIQKIQKFLPKTSLTNTTIHDIAKNLKKRATPLSLYTPCRGRFARFADDRHHPGDRLALYPPTIANKPGVHPLTTVSSLLKDSKTNVHQALLIECFTKIGEMKMHGGSFSLLAITQRTLIFLKKVSTSYCSTGQGDSDRSVPEITPPRRLLQTILGPRTWAK